MLLKPCLSWKATSIKTPKSEISKLSWMMIRHATSSAAGPLWRRTQEIWAIKTSGAATCPRPRSDDLTRVVSSLLLRMRPMSFIRVHRKRSTIKVFLRSLMIPHRCTPSRWSKKWRRPFFRWIRHPILIRGSSNGCLVTRCSSRPTLISSESKLTYSSSKFIVTKPNTLWNS